MRLRSFFSVFFALVSLPVAETDAKPALESFTPEQIDRSLDPCSDFFQYACSKWLKANPIPADQAGWGTFNSLVIWNVAAIHNTLEDAAAKSSNRTSTQQKAGDYYASCMDEAAINKAGVAPLQPMLDRIANLKDKPQFPELIV